MKIMLLRLHLSKWAIIIIANLFRIELYACVPSDRSSHSKIESARHLNSTHIVGYLKKNESRINSSWKNHDINDFSRVSENVQNQVRSGPTIFEFIQGKNRKDTFLMHQQEKPHKPYSGEVKPVIFMTKIGTAIFKIPFEERFPSPDTYAKFHPTTTPDIDVLDIETVPPHLDIPFPERKKRQVPTLSTVDTAILNNDKILKTSTSSSDYINKDFFIQMETLKKEYQANKDILNSSEFSENENEPSTINDYTFYSVQQYPQKDANSEDEELKFTNVVYKTTRNNEKAPSVQNSDESHKVFQTQDDDMQRRGRSLFLFRGTPDKIQIEDSYSKKTINFIKSLVEDAPWESLFMQMVKEVIDHFVDKTLEHLFASHKEKRSADNLINWTELMSKVSVDFPNMTTEEKQDFFKMVFRQYFNSDKEENELMSTLLRTMNLPPVEGLKHKTLLKILAGKISNTIFNIIIEKYNNLVKNPEIMQFFLNSHLNFSTKLKYYQNEIDVNEISKPSINETLSNHAMEENAETKTNKNSELDSSYIIVKVNNEEYTQEDSINNSSEFDHQQNLAKFSSTIDYKNFQKVNEEDQFNIFDHKNSYKLLETEPSLENQNGYFAYVRSFSLPRKSRALFPFRNPHTAGDEKIHIKDSYGHKTLKFIRSLVEDAPWESMFMRMVRMVVDHFVEKTLEHLFAGHKDKRSLDYDIPYLSDVFALSELFEMKNNHIDKGEHMLKLILEELSDQITEKLPTLDHSSQSPDQHFSAKSKTMASTSFNETAMKEFLHQFLLHEIITKLNNNINSPTRLSFNLLSENEDKYKMHKTDHDSFVYQFVPMNTESWESDATTQENGKMKNTETEESNTSDISTAHLKFILDKFFNQIQNKHFQNLNAEKLQFDSVVYRAEKDNTAGIVQRTRRSASTGLSFREHIRNRVKHQEIGKDKSKATKSKVVIQVQHSDKVHASQTLKEANNINYFSFMKKLIADLMKHVFQTSPYKNRIKRSKKLWYDENEKPPNQKKFIGCSLRSACNAGRLLSRLPSVHEITMQLRTPGDNEPHWDALLWGMKKKRCTHLTCKRYRAPKGSKYYNKRIMQNDLLPLKTTTTSRT